MVTTIHNVNQKQGYKRMELGDIPEDWRPTPLGSLSAFITKGATPTTYGFRWVNDGVLFLRSECVSEQGLDLSQSMFITAEAHNMLKRGEVHAGDILVTITGNVGRVISLSNDFGVANINQHIARIRIIDSDVVAGYVFHFLSQPSIRKYYNSITTGQAYPQISLKQVRDTRIPIPPTTSEQQAIATALSDVDALITSLDKLIAKKRDIKQTTMQRLLTGKTRLPGFGDELKLRYKQTEIGFIPEDWEPRPLGLISAFITKGATPTTYGFSWANDGVLFLRSECVSEQGLDLTQSMFITSEAHNILKRGEVHAGDILMTITGNVGRVIYLGNGFSIANINQHIARIRITDSSIDANYVFHFLSQPALRKYYNSITTGQAYPQISLKQVRDTRIPIPPTKSEQQAIANVLSDMDAEITALEHRRKKTHMLKHAMMQELLTGKTRLI
ncbi:restriction endonuclease subunit S [Ktedonobacteria bacterium brp13]|nr:restriction endonuclease subunit S [Ktedonobacteria bacterium brp13]